MIHLVVHDRKTFVWKIVGVVMIRIVQLPMNTSYGKMFVKPL